MIGDLLRRIALGRAGTAARPAIKEQYGDMGELILNQPAIPAEKPKGGLLGSGGEFGEGGLLFDPQFRRGLAYLSAGSRGVDPMSAMIQQGKIEQLRQFEQANKDRAEAKSAVQQYVKTLPEDSLLRVVAKSNPNKALDYLTKIQVAEINRRGKTTAAQRDALAMGLKPGTKEFNDYIKRATIKTEAAAQGLQRQGRIVSKQAGDKLVSNITFMKRNNQKIDDVIAKIQKDPTLVGGIGSVRRGANQIGTLLKDIGVDVKSILPAGVSRDFVFDKNIATTTALERALAPAYARVLFPGQKITNQQLSEAAAAIKLTGLSGSEEVINRIREVQRDIQMYIRMSEGMLGVQNQQQPTLTTPNIPSFRVNPNTGKLERQ